MVPSCAAPEPPANVPDDAAAQSDAESLFAGMGYDTDALEYDVYADEWGASVTGWLLLDGARSPIAVSVGFGADGVVTWASGALAEPQRASDYPLGRCRGRRCPSQRRVRSVDAVRGFTDGRCSHGGIGWHGGGDCHCRRRFR